MGQVSSSIYDVAIVGCGPTGATLAGLLGQAGLRVLICDKDLEIYPKPRAVAMDHEIMRTFQELGLEDKLQPITEAFTDSEFYGVDGQLIKCMTSIKPPFPMTFTPSMVFNQPSLERILRNKIKKMPTVELLLGYEMIDFLQNDQGVTFTLSHQNKKFIGSSKYLIACDGASSFTRKSLGIKFEDLGFDEPWLVVDVLLNKSGLKKTPKVSVQYCNPERPTTFVICTKNHRRWEIAINPEDNFATTISDQQTWNLLKPWITPKDGTLWRQAAYRFHALLAQRWISGRVILAGDAAHQQPPFLGQGMCQGIRDAKNLAWKLQAILIRNAPKKLLNTYEIERKEHVRELTNRIKNIGKLVSERNFSKAVERDRRLREEAAGPIPRVPRQDVQPFLKNGLFSKNIHSIQGSLFPQAWILSNKKYTRMDPILGVGWRIFLHPNIKNLKKLKLPKGLPVIQIGSDRCLEKENVLMNWFDKHNIKAALVRPDHYVYGVANNIQELQSDLNELRNYANEI